jgi:mono/diheme cytochrome c family protein
VAGRQTSATIPAAAESGYGLLAEGGFEMAKLLRWTGYVLGLLLLLALAAAGYVWVVSSRELRAHAPKTEPLATPTAAQLADGPRQLHVLGCVSCHGELLQGDLFMDEPNLAKIYAPNLTQVAAKASDQQLAQAIRQGIGHDGRSLLVMPSEGYQFMTDAEVAALISAIRTLPRAGPETPPRSLGPIGHVGLASGKFRSAPALVDLYRASPLADFGPQFARGRHIVAVNCAECHGPNLEGQEVKPGTVSADLSIVGAYDAEQFKTLLRKGVAPGGKQMGMMGEVARSDFKHLDDREIAAIHAYLVERARRMP